jgi:uncharacterized membrane protein
MPSAGGRVAAVDIYRGIAIVLMLFQHSVLYLYPDMEGEFMGWAALLSRLSAPIFVLLAGYCVHLSAERRIPAGGRGHFLLHALKRAVELFAVGLLVNIIRSDPLSYVNILDLIGISVIAASLLRVTESRAAYAVTIAVLGAYSFASPRYHSDLLITSPLDVPAWLMTTGEYPSGSWLIYAVIGLGLARYMGGRLPGGVRLFFAGEGLMLLAVLLLASGMRAGLVANHAPFLFAMLGSLCVLQYGLSEAVKIPSLAALSGILSTYGRHSLGIYAIHLFVFARIPVLFGLENSLSEAAVIAALAAFLAAAYAAARAYEAGRGG